MTVKLLDEKWLILEHTCKSAGRQTKETAMRNKARFPAAQTSQPIPDVFMSSPKLAELNTAVEQATSIPHKADALNALANYYRERDPVKATEIARHILEITADLQPPYLSARGRAELTLSYCAGVHSEFDKAMIHGENAMRFFETAGDRNGYCDALLRLSANYFYTSQFKKAHELAEQALTISQAAGYRFGISRSYIALSNLYTLLGDLVQAIEIRQKGLIEAEAIGSEELICMALNNFASAYQDMGRYERALEYLYKCLEYEDYLEGTIIQGVVYINLAESHFNLKQIEQAQRYIAKVLAVAQPRGIQLMESYAITLAGNIKLHENDPETALTLFRQGLTIRQAFHYMIGVVESLHKIGRTLLQMGRTDEAEAAFAESLQTATDIGLKRGIYQAHQGLADVYYRRGQTDLAYTHLLQYHQIKETVLNNDAVSKAANLKVLNEIALVQKEREVTDRLLGRIMPHSIADRLKKGENPIADYFDEVTVLFADIVDFTKLSAAVTPARLVESLNYIFSEFDKLAEAFQLEKIKTIGDAYMVVGGIPVSRADHAEAVARMALAMQAKMADFQTMSGHQLQIRIGIHSGPVIAGVIGANKFAYDLWGDTVNTASRMESHGAPDQIHCSEAVYRALYARFDFSARGPVVIKGKGQMSTYYLQQLKASEV